MKKGDGNINAYEKNQIKNIIFIIGSIIIITFLHYSTVNSKWGIHDFYRRLYYIPIIIAAFKFKIKGGTISAIAIAIFYAPHLILYFGKINMEVLNQFFEIIMFIVIGIITGFLVEADYRKKEYLRIQIEKLTNLENEMQNILDSITNVFISVDNKLNVRLVNGEYINLFRFENSEEKYKLEEIFVEYDAVKTQLIRIIEGNISKVSMETECVTKNNEIIHAKLIAYPIIDSLGRGNGAVIVLEDLSEIRKLESHIRRSEKLSAIGELASGIAHEIRNPLGIIKTIAQTMKQEANDNDMNEGLEIIVDEIDRANKVIEGLLNFAKPNLNKRKIYMINYLLDEIILITKKYAQKYNVEINYRSQSEEKLYGDKESIKQAFVNIVLNAIQAMPNGGNLNVFEYVKDGFCVVSFEDSGVGIKANIEKIFEPFYTTKNDGTGLGLAITHRIIEEHSGYICVSSEIDKGTKVDVYMPLLKKGELYEKKDTNSR